MLPILLLTGFAIHLSNCSATKTINITAAVQNQKQVYFSYLSYISSCNYSQPNIYSGEIRIQQLNSQVFYDQIAYHDMVVFWSSVPNGLTIMALLEQYTTEYDGYILYDSPIIDFYRDIILYTISNSTNGTDSQNCTNCTYLTFYYATPYISLHNLSVVLDITRQQLIDLDAEAEEILQNCSIINNQNFAYLGDQLFMFVCGQLEAGFVFSPKNIAIQNSVLNLSELNPGNYSISSNPHILARTDYQQQFHWNAVLMSTNQSQSESSIYFFIYNKKSANFTILSLDDMEPQITLIINRIWGIQVKKEFSKWMDLFTTFNVSQINSDFPGTIVSVFVSSHQNIFVQSTTDDGINYLCVFNSEGSLYWNISYVGAIIYYGSQAIFIYNADKNKIYFIQVTRPMFALDVNQLKNTTVDTFYNTSLSIPCQNNFQLQYNYNILWTTLSYPSALIICKDPSPIITADVVYGFQVQDKFQVIGPDFEVMVNAPQNIKVVIIDASTIRFSQQAIDIINVEFYNDNLLSVIFFTNDTVYEIDSHLSKKTLAVEPCGFNSIKSSTKTQNKTYILTNSKNQNCQCTLNFVDCHLVSTNFVYSQLLAKDNFKSSRSSFIKALSGDFLALPYNQVIAVKRNLYGLINFGLIVSILQNNTVLLVDIHANNAILDSVLVDCLSPNSTNGDIYIRQFFDPYLILFCEKSSTLYQLIIRKGRMIPQRQIPLYRFYTRSGRNTFFPAFSYVFISVDPMTYIYPMPTNCCVLRLDLSQYTVSVITQIINAESVIVVTNYRNVDVALFKSVGDENTTFIIKAYFPRVWITLDQTNHTQIVEVQQIPIIFESSIYNFGASFKIQTIFNLTNTNLNLTKVVDSSDTVLEDVVLDFTPVPGSSLLTNKSLYALNRYICGPIFDSYFFRAVQNMTNLQIIQSDVITKKKIIGNVGIQFLQLINPAKFSVPNLTLNDLILAVSVDKMYVFDKLLNNVQLQAITNFTLPQKRCTYYLFGVVNNTAATFTANCQGLNYNYRSPMLTLNYIPSTSTLTYSYLLVKVPLNLRQIYTIVQENLPTLVLGIIEGPMNAETGRLYLCQDFMCSSLYVSTSDSFLLNYGVKTSGSLYVIMSIDYQTIQIFISPQVTPDQAPISPNYTINYTNFLSEPYCSSIRVLNISTTTSFCIISCTSFYYYAQINFISSSINIIQKFARYSQCDLQDQFNPSAIFDNDLGIQMIMAECRQNGYILRLQEYQTINSSTPTIYTGYLQVFVVNGPLGPNCSTASTSPSKIIPLSTSMNYPVYMTYSITGQSGQKIHKFIYLQINGVLVDNLLEIQPSVTVMFQPLIVDFQYPSIKFAATNEYHTIQQIVGTQQIFSNSITYINIIAFVVFALANLITLICLICYLYQKRKGNRNSLMLQNRDSTPMGGVEDTLYEENLKSIRETVRDREVSTMRKTNRPSQIEMFFVKKK